MDAIARDAVERTSVAGRIDRVRGDVTDDERGGLARESAGEIAVDLRIALGGIADEDKRATGPATQEGLDAGTLEAFGRGEDRQGGGVFETESLEME